MKNTHVSSPTLFEEIKEAGIPFSNHASDLYVKDCPSSREILEKYPLQRRNSTRFINLTNNELWIDIPFEYTPYWNNLSLK
jgi:hypothetical protein